MGSTHDGRRILSYIPGSIVHSALPLLIRAGPAIGGKINFATRITLVGTSGNDTGEPNPVNASILLSSAWCTWTVPAGVGDGVIDLSGSFYDTTLGVYTGRRD